MAFPKKKYWIEAGDIKTKLPKQHDTGMFRSLDEIVWDILKCCGWDCCTQAETVGEREVPLTFENGVTRTSNTVKLGGTLTSNTLISGNDKTLTINFVKNLNEATTAMGTGGTATTVTNGTSTSVVNQTPDLLTVRSTLGSAAKVGINTITPTSVVHAVGLLEYADEAAAVLGGILTTGAFYRTPTGVVMVKL